MSRRAMVLCAATFAALCALSAQEPRVNTRYIPASQVSATFAKGGTLVDRNDGNYSIMAAHREKPGEVEVHELDTDIVYVVQGKAELVTGGSVVDAITTAKNEVRAGSITGGESRQLSQGDVVIIPAGIPHWFREVPAAFDYLVVKVR